MPVDPKIINRYHLPMWKKALNVFLGWSEDQTREWAKSWEKCDEAQFLHESAIHFIDSLLVPERLKQKVLERNDWYKDLYGRIREAIRFKDGPHLPLTLKILEGNIPREQWSKLFDEWIETKVRAGEWLREGREEEYDWQAAKLRLEKVLADYGESLPGSASVDQLRMSAEDIAPRLGVYEGGAKKAREYLNSWKRALGALLGWPEEKVVEWAKEEYGRELNNPDLWVSSSIYECSSMRHIARLLLPQRLKSRESVEVLSQIVTAIVCRHSPPVPEELTRLIGQVPVNDWLKEFEKYHQEAVARGDWFSEEVSDQYDWKAASARVEKLLNKYGESLLRIAD